MKGWPVAAAELPGEKTLVVTHNFSQVMYHAATSTWTNEKWTPGLSGHDQFRYGSLALLPGGRALWIFDGFCKVYDAAADRWSNGPNVKGFHEDHAVATLPDGRVLVSGRTNLHKKGSRIYTPTADSPQGYVFNRGLLLPAGVWSRTQLPDSLYHVTTLPDGRLMVLQNSWKEGCSPINCFFSDAPAVDDIHLSKLVWVPGPPLPGGLPVFMVPMSFHKPSGPKEAQGSAC